MSRKAMQVALEALESDPISHAGLVTVLSPGKGTGLNYANASQKTAVSPDGGTGFIDGVWGAVQCKPQEEVEDGWCDWVCPKPVGYLMQCCDCELIHEVDFRVVRYESEDSEVYEVVDDPDLQAQMRLRRRDDLSPKREWVGLTDEEHDSIKRNYHNMTWTLEMFARAIEQALKEKNT